jgi:hypothetical protein
MSTVFDLLHKIQQKPGLYIGTTSVTVLRHFLVGYKFARQEMNLLPTEAELDFYREFQPWLQKRLQGQMSQSWDQIILARSTDEKTAFETFFQLLSEFRQRNSIPLVENAPQKTTPQSSGKVA